MIKRILIDFNLLKTLFPDLVFKFLQLETQLVDDHTTLSIESIIANKSTYTLMSYFPNLDLQIMPLLEGKRMMDQPIHEPQNFKEMKPNFVEHVVRHFSELLTPFV